MAGGYLRELRKLVSNGRYDDAAALALNVLRKQRDGADMKAIHDILESCAMESDGVAAGLLRLYTTGLLPEPREGFGAELAERLMRNPDKGIARHGHLALGILHTMQGRPHLGMKVLRDAMAKGFHEAKIAMAMLYASGSPGREPDLARGITLLVEAVNEGTRTARVMLAKILIENNVEVDGIDVEEMLNEAVEDGDMAEEAMRMLDDIADTDSEEESEEDYDDENLPRNILSYEVVPDGMERMLVVRDAMMETFGMPGDVAETTVARMSGFCCWPHMEKEACNPDMPKGVFDEDCDPAELNDRRDEQMEVLISQGVIDEIVAAKIAGRLAVTARKGTPSFETLRQELAEEGYGGIAPREPGTAVPEASLEGLLRLIRDSSPIRPKAWLSTLERFGWRLQNKRPKVRKAGSLIAQAPAGDGTDYGVFLCSGSYLPGSEDDERAEARMADIARKGKPAVLLFNRPVGMVSPKRKKGLLYGGKVFSGKEWWDFVLRPDGGIEDAIGQRGKLRGKPSSAFLKEYSFSSAKEACVELAAAADGDGIEEGDTVSFIQYPSGWSEAVTGIGAEFLRIATEMER